MCTTVLFLCVWQMRITFCFVCVRSVTSVYCRFYPHLFALYVIKIDESWRLKLRSTCQLFYDHILDKKSPNFSLSFVSEIHDYETRSTYLQHLNTCTFRINIRRFCPTVIGCYYWNDIPMLMREKPTRKLLKVQFLCIISLSIYQCLPLTM